MLRDARAALLGAALFAAPALAVAQAAPPSHPPPYPYPPPAYPAYPPPAYPPPAYPPPAYPPPAYPPPAYPPPAYPPPAYPPPAYPPPAYAPPPAPEPPAIIDNWDPDSPAPRGYRLDDTVNGRMLGVGIGLLGTGWFLSVIAGGVGAAAEEDEENDTADGVSAEDWSVLYLPVVGPLIAIDTLDARTSGVGVLIADAVIQIGGAAGIVTAFIDRRYRLVQKDYGAITVTPLVWPGAQGLSARGRF